MKFFIDTANLDQIKEAYDMGVLDGVTTNPSLMAKEGIKGVDNQRKHYVEICNIVQGDVSAEVIATEYEGMIKEGEELAALNPHIVVKVPCIAGYQIFHFQRYPYQLYIGIFCRTSFAGCQSGSYLCISVCGTSGRYL